MTELHVIGFMLGVIAALAYRHFKLWRRYAEAIKMRDRLFDALQLRRKREVEAQQLPQIRN